MTHIEIHDDHMVFPEFITLISHGDYLYVIGTEHIWRTKNPSTGEWELFERERLE